MDTITGKQIIQNFGGDEKLKELGFEWIERGCNSFWGITKVYRDIRMNGYDIVQYRCVGQLKLKTYLCGYIGVCFYINDEGITKEIIKNMQVRTLDELKSIVDLFNKHIA